MIHVHAKFVARRYGKLATIIFHVYAASMVTKNATHLPKYGIEGIEVNFTVQIIKLQEKKVYPTDETGKNSVLI